MQNANHLQRTYTGLLDDVMLKYSSDFRGERFFNKMIVKNVLFGGGIYLNDGYLVNHPVARRYLMREDSLLRLMISTNFIRLLSRTKDPDGLSRMPETMAASGSASFDRLVKSREWTRFKPVFHRLAQSLFYNKNVRSWPGFDISHGFVNLIERTAKAAPTDLGLNDVDLSDWLRFHDAFQEKMPRESNARHKYEVALGEVLGEGNRKGMRQAMDIANQAYHYNIGMMLTHDPEEEADVAVDTTMGDSFDELLQTRQVHYGQLDGLELIQVPADLPLDNGDIFRPFVDPTSAVARAKFEYLDSLRLVLAPDPKDLSYLQKHVRDATKLYISRMRRIFKEKLGKDLARDAFGSGSIRFAMASIRQPGRRARESDIVATAAPTLGLAITLQAQAMNMSRHFLVERFRLTDKPPASASDPDSVIRLGDIRPHIASLAFNPIASREHVEKLPRFTI